MKMSTGGGWDPSENSKTKCSVVFTKDSEKNLVVKKFITTCRRQGKRVIDRGGDWVSKSKSSKCVIDKEGGVVFDMTMEKMLDFKKM